MGERSPKNAKKPLHLKASAEGEMIKHQVVLEGKIASSLPSVLRISYTYKPTTSMPSTFSTEIVLLSTRSHWEVPDAGCDALLLGSGAGK